MEGFMDSLEGGNNTRFEQFVDMIRSRAHFYSRCYHIEYAEVEAQGFLIYCMSVEQFNSSKASFSTYLFQNLSGRLRDFCVQYTRKTVKDNQDTDESIDTIETLPAKTELNQEEFLEYSEMFLSPIAFKVLSWIVSFTWNKPGSGKKIHIAQIRRVFDLDLRYAKQIWAELGEFWQNKGADFFAV
jgi:hypothetical protein